MHNSTSYIVVAVIQTLLNCGHQRLQQFRLLELAQKTQGRTANEFVVVLKVLWASTTSNK
jgi:hypothetical protein